jgi:uncharacterized protein
MRLPTEMFTSVFFGGEPLLNMEFIKQIVNYLEENPCSVRYFTFSMTTNSILLERYMDYLVEKKSIKSTELFEK